MGGGTHMKVDIVRRTALSVCRLIASTQASPSLSNVARECRMSPASLQRRLRRSGRWTFREIRSHCATCAAAGLIADGVKVAAAITLVGLKNTTHFNTHFKQQYGCVPSQYMRATECRCACREVSDDH